MAVQTYVTFPSVSTADSAFRKFPGKVSRDSAGIMTKLVPLADGGKAKVTVRRMQAHNGATMQAVRAAKVRKVSARAA